VHGARGGGRERAAAGSCEAPRVPPRTFDELLARALAHARSHGRPVMGVAAAEDGCALGAAHDAWKMGLITPVLVGDPREVARAAKDEGVDVSKWRVIASPDPVESCRRAVELVRKGELDLLMKGKVQTADLMRAALDRENGIRAGTLMSHIAMLSTPEFGRILCMSDGGIVLNPTLEDKVGIIQNSVDAMHRLGWDCPKVAVVCAFELVNPRMQPTVDAAALAKMNERGQITGCIVDGPLGFDNAINEVAAERKGIRSPVAGKADLVIFSEIDVGNVFYKALAFMTGTSEHAGVLVGAKVPIVMASRSDGAEIKRNSIAAGVVIAQARKD
jgi:phosphate butyryltransferase